MPGWAMPHGRSTEISEVSSIVSSTDELNSDSAAARIKVTR